MKKICLMTLALVALIITGCSKDHKHDKETLLSMMPNDVAFASVSNIDGVLKSLGSTVKDNKVDFDATVAMLMSADSDLREIKNLLEGGDTGIELSYMGFFMTRDESAYAVGFLDDPDKFVKYVEKESGKEFQKEKGLKYIKKDNDYLIVDGDMWWFAHSEKNALDNVKNYIDLDKEKSLGGSKVGQRMLQANGDLMMDINMKEFSKMFTADYKMTKDLGEFMSGAALIFDDFNSVLYSVKFKENTLEAYINILNSKGDDAKTSIPLGTIDPATIKALDVSNANFLGAVGFSPASIKMFVDKMQTMGADADAVNMVKGISGTIALAVADPDNIVGAIDFSNTAYDEQLMTTVYYAGYGNLERRGGRLYWTTNPNGKFVGGQQNVDKMAEQFQGKFLGAAVSNLGGVISRGKVSTSDLTYVTMESKNGGVEIKITSAFKDGKHYLLSLINEWMKVENAKPWDTTSSYYDDSYDADMEEPTASSQIYGMDIYDDIDMDDLSPEEQQMVRDIVGNVTNQVMSGK